MPENGLWLSARDVSPSCSKATFVKFDMDAVVAKIDNVGVEGVDSLRSSSETIMPGNYTCLIGL